MSVLAVIGSTGEYGGAEATDIHYLSALVAAGVDVRVALPAEGGLRARLEDVGVHCEIVESPPALNAMSRRYTSARAVAPRLVSAAARYERRLLRWLLSTRPTACLATGFRAQLAVTPLAAALRLPLGWVASDFVPVEPAACRLWARLARFTRVVVTYSHAAAAQPGLRRAPYVAPVLSGIQLDRFPPGPEDREPILLMVGHLTPLKNHLGFADVVRSVARGVPDVRGIIAGSDLYRTAAHRDYPEQVRSVVATFPPGRLELVAPAPEAVPALMRRAAVLMHLSLVPETFGLVCLEAMASGCPVVAFDHGAVPEVVGDTGRLVAMGDLDGAATAATELLTSAPARVRLARNARARAERGFDAARAGSEGADALARSLGL